MRIPLLIVTLLCFPVLAPAQDSQSTGLTRLLEAELGRMPAKAGLYVKHLGTGEEAGVLANEPFNSYSVIKIPIMVRAYELADQQKIDLGERHVITRSDFRGGSGIFRHHDPGWNPTLRDLIVEMIITSDNTATDLVLAKVGGVDTLNAWLAAKGYAKTSMVMTLFEFFRKPFEIRDPTNRNLTPEQLLVQQLQQPFIETREERIKRDEDRRYWLGVMTPRETGRMLEEIERGTAASKQSCDDMKRILLAQQAGARRIPHFLPPGYRVAHKTGDGPSIIANDVGLVYARSGTIIISFFTTNNRGLWQDLEDQIGRVSRLIVDYFDGRVESVR